MFNKVLKKTVIKLEDRVQVLKDEKERLQDNVYELRREVTNIRSQNKIDEERIQHMVKMAEEANEIRYQKKVMENEKDKWEGIATVKDTYRDKLEVRLQKEVEGIKEMYGQILERLPNISGKFKGTL